jgi:hypothetical protein
VLTFAINQTNVRDDEWREMVARAIGLLTEPTKG